VGSFSNGEIHSNPASIQLHAISPLLGLFCICCGFKVDKGKSPGATGLLVINDVHLSQRAILGEHIPQVSLCGVQTEPKYPKTKVWVWVSPVADVSAAVRHGRVAVAPMATILPATRSAPGAVAAGVGARVGA
jgi:hypothetical protein